MTAQSDSQDIAGFRCISLGEVTSTNDEVLKLVQAGEAGEFVVSGRSQSQGRGRFDRVWTSPRGNLYCSVLLRPNLPLMQCSSLSLVLAISLRDALAEFLPDTDLTVKWPNDVLAGGKKIAGILLESEAMPDGLARHIIAGTGVNLISHPGVPKKPATDASALGAKIAPHDLLTRYLERFAAYRAQWLAGGFPAIKPAWMRYAHGAARNVTVNQGARSIRGLFAGLDDEGNLRLMTGRGEERIILAGELAFDVEPTSN